MVSQQKTDKPKVALDPKIAAAAKAAQEAKVKEAAEAAKAAEEAIVDVPDRLQEVFGFAKQYTAKEYTDALNALPERQLSTVPSLVEGTEDFANAVRKAFIKENAHPSKANASDLAEKITLLDNYVAKEIEALRKDEGEVKRLAELGVDLEKIDHKRVSALIIAEMEQQAILAKGAAPEKGEKQGAEVEKAELPKNLPSKAAKGPQHGAKAGMGA